MERSFDFSIVRICPDPCRGEIINIGICIYLEQHLDVRIFPSMRKARALHGEIDTGYLYELGSHFNGWVADIKGTNERYELLRDFGIILLSEPGVFLAEEIEYEATVSDLMTKLVIPTAERYSLRSRRQPRLRWWLFRALYSLRHQRWLPLRVKSHLGLLATYIGVRRVLNPRLPFVSFPQILGLQPLPSSSSNPGYLMDAYHR